MKGFFNVTFAGKKFACIELEDGKTAEDLNQELKLLKWVYGRASNKASVNLDKYYKKNKTGL